MIRKIYISWRKKPGDRRFLIAMLKRNAKVMSFKYLDEFTSAKEEGLNNSFGFGKDADKLSSSDIQNILNLRVVSKEKADKQDFLQFWEVDKFVKDDTFILLALTQGKSPTDNFEFLADFSDVEKKRKISFITDLSGLSHTRIDRGSVKKGDILTYKPEPFNEHDKEAVAVYKDDLKIGYIKKIHNRVFSKWQNLKLTVKTVDENGVIRQVFIKVEGG